MTGKNLDLPRLGGKGGEKKGLSRNPSSYSVGSDASRNSRREGNARFKNAGAAGKGVPRLNLAGGANHKSNFSVSNTVVSGSVGTSYPPMKTV